MSVNGMISATGNIPPYTGEYDPDQDMALFNNGQDPNGTWFLVVTDMAGADSGTVDTWSLTFGSDPTHTVWNLVTCCDRHSAFARMVLRIAICCRT